jgi:hypothetical protein
MGKFGNTYGPKIVREAARPKLYLSALSPVGVLRHYCGHLVRLIMSKEGCHGTEAKIFSGVQAGCDGDAQRPRPQRQLGRDGTRDWGNRAWALAVRIASGVGAGVSGEWLTVG